MSSLGLGDFHAGQRCRLTDESFGRCGQEALVHGTEPPYVVIEFDDDPHSYRYWPTSLELLSTSSKGGRPGAPEPHCPRCNLNWVTAAPEHVEHVGFLERTVYPQAPSPMFQPPSIVRFATWTAFCWRCEHRWTHEERA